MPNKLFDSEVDYKFGIEEIDDQHASLINMVNEIHTMIGDNRKQEAVALFLEVMPRFLTEHLPSEEAFMEKIGFPKLEDHRKLHEGFRSNMSKFIELIKAGDENAFRAAVSDSYLWVLTHINRTDRKYMDFYRSKNT